jgi:two-component system, LytTR family, response regulator AlgR
VNQPELRVLIVDDEAPARSRLRDVLSDIAPNEPSRVVGMVGNGEEALGFLAEHSADVALVDVRMPVLDGVDLAKRLAEMPNPPAVIFTTAFDEYAVRAFDLAVTDYLVKPVRAQRLAEALAKVRRQRSLAFSSAPAPEKPRDYLSIVERGRITRLPVADVLYFLAEGKYTLARTRVHEYLLEESLTHLEAEHPERFLRIHRNCLVAKSAIQGVSQRRGRFGGASPSSPWEISIYGWDERLAVSRRLLPAVRKALGE